MNTKTKAWTLVVIWMIFTIIISSLPTTKSIDITTKVIDKSLTKTVDLSNNINITNIDTNSKKKIKIINILIIPLHKAIQIIIFIILGILVMNAFTKSNISLFNAILYTILFCFLYANLIEIYQTIIKDKINQRSDVLIKTLGSFTGIFLYSLYYKLFSKKGGIYWLKL